jgi:hypothetical protein
MVAVYSLAVAFVSASVNVATAPVKALPSVEAMVFPVASICFSGVTFSRVRSPNEVARPRGN